MNEQRLIIKKIRPKKIIIRLNKITNIPDVRANEDKLLAVMQKIAKEKDISFHVDIKGNFINEADNKRKLSFAGSTYGFCVKLDEVKKKEVFDEATAKETNRLTDITQFKPIFDDVYPLYWGKDKSLGSRLSQHLNKYAKNGAVKLCRYTSLHGKSISYAVSINDDSKLLEKKLQESYPPLLKTMQE